MAVLHAGVVTNSIQALYQSEFVMAARRNYVYSQAPLAYTPPGGVIGMGNRGTSVNLPVYNRFDPSITALSCSADVTPVTFNDGLVTVTPDIYGQAVQLFQKLSLTAFTDIEAAAAANVADAASDVRDRLARIQACSGSVVSFGGDATTRATVGTGSSAYEMGYSDWLDAIAFLKGPRSPMLPDPAGVAAIISHQTYADQLEDGVIILAGEYSAGAYPFLFNYELGTHIAGARVIVSDFAKVFHGAGASGAMNAEALATAAVAGATTLTLSATVASGAVGDYVAVGTVEATGVADPIITETVMLVGSTNVNPQPILGGSPAGGLIFGHACAAAVTHSAQVHAAVFMTANALPMVYTNDDGLGPDGILIPPENTGLLKQFNTMGWKGFWGFSRFAENRLYRIEHEPSRVKLGD